MSNIERVLHNRPRFSWEVTIADVIQLIVLIGMAVKLYDQVQVHDTQIKAHDTQIRQMSDNQNDQNRRLSVLEDRQGRFYERPMESSRSQNK